MSHHLRSTLENLRDAIASIYTEDEDIRKAVLEMMRYLERVLSQPDNRLPTYRQEVYARLQDKSTLLEGTDVANADIINNIRRIAVDLRPNNAKTKE